MGRANDMAEINTYLAESNQPTQVIPPVNTAASSEAVDAPTLQEGKKPPTTKEQKAQVELAIKEAQLDKLQEEKAERQSIREMQAAQTEATRIREEESEARQRSREIVQGVTDQAVRTQERIGQSVREAGSAIGSVPIPGSILLPLTILLLFFFVLIPINGHTRLMWLWLVLTGNAHLTGENLATTTTTTPTSPIVAPPFPSTSTQPVAPPFPSSGSITVIPKPTPGGQASGTLLPIGNQGQGHLGFQQNTLGQGSGMLSPILPFRGVGEPS